MDLAKWPFSIPLLLLIFLGHHFTVADQNPTVDVDTIHIIKDGQILVSDNNNFALGFFGFGNGNSSTRRYVGIWYNKIPDLPVVWVANRNTPLNDKSGNFVIDRHGSLVIYSLMQNISLWSTNVSVSTKNDDSNMSVKLLDTGNLVVVQRENQKILWQSFDYPSNTLLPYMKLGFNRRTGFSWFLTSWKALDDPGDGNFTCRMNPAGFPQLILYEGSVPKYRIGSWTGQRWSGVTEMTRTYILNTSFVDDADEVSVMNGVTMNDVLTRMNLDESGLVHRSTWLDRERGWNEFWKAPTEWCDGYNRCGPNSNCDPYNADQYLCTCLPGFEPKSQRDWLLREPSGGCIRKRENATCRSGEGFVVVAGVKVPDTSEARVDKNMSLEACGQACLKDCNCTAYTSADETTGIGCVTWYGDHLVDTRTFANASFGQDLYVRVDAIELAAYAKKSKHHSTKKKVVAAIIFVSVVALLLLVASLVYIRKKARKRKERYRSLSYLGESRNSKELDESKRNSDLPVFDLNTIANATDHFSSYNKLGEGGFGTVYKGKLKSGVEIAVKRLAKNSGQGVGEFKNEVTLIAKLQHRNLVRIFGYCVQHEEKMLVYEYLPNKSLDSFIFGMSSLMFLALSFAPVILCRTKLKFSAFNLDESKRALLDWTKRLEIINGIARGILYLHQDSRLKIIHRDLKTSNVLLDIDLNPKIADFGMARIFGQDQIQASTNRIVGTYGYMSPEYAMEGLFSVKSDVYSFGVLLLEIITGRKNGNFSDDSSFLSLVGQVWELWRQEKVMEVVDSTLDDPSSVNAIMRCIQIGLLCVQEDATDRPTMATIVFLLGNEVTVPSPKKPAFILKRKYYIGDPSSSTEGPNSINDVTITMFEAR